MNHIAGRHMTHDEIVGFSNTLAAYLTMPQMQAVRGADAELLFYRALWYVAGKQEQFVSAAAVSHLSKAVRRAPAAIAMLVEAGLFIPDATRDGYRIAPPGGGVSANAA